MDEEEKKLLAELRSGSDRAFDVVYARHRSALFAFLCRLAGNRQLAADLFQNTWLKLARTAPRLREDTDLRAWLFTVARNEYRSHQRWQRLDVSRVFQLRESADSFGPEQGELGVLAKALGRLSVSDREVLLLVGAQGFAQEEAAAILGISHEALRQRLTRARKRLRDVFEELDG